MEIPTITDNIKTKDTEKIKNGWENKFENRYNQKNRDGKEIEKLLDILLDYQFMGIGTREFNT